MAAQVSARLAIVQLRLTTESRGLLVGVARANDYLPVAGVVCWYSDTNINYYVAATWTARQSLPKAPTSIAQPSPRISKPCIACKGVKRLLRVCQCSP